MREVTQLSGSGKGRETEEVMLLQSGKRRVEASQKSSAVQESVAPVLLPAQGGEGRHVPAQVIQGRNARNVGEASGESWRRISGLECKSPGLLVRLMKRLSSFPLCLI